MHQPSRSIHHALTVVDAPCFTYNADHSNITWINRYSHSSAINGIWTITPDIKVFNKLNWGRRRNHVRAQHEQQRHARATGELSGYGRAEYYNSEHKNSHLRGSEISLLSLHVADA